MTTERGQGQGGRSVPDWLLERLVRGELPAAEAARLRAQLEAAGQSDRLAALERSDRDILAVHPAAAVTAEVHRRLGQAEARTRAARTSGPQRRLAFAFSGLAVGAVGVAALLLVIRPSDDGVHPNGEGIGSGIHLPGDPADTIRFKSDSRIRIYLKTTGGGDPVPLVDGSKVRAGDNLQVAYVAGNKRYGVVASVDARGTVTLHLPEAPGAAPRLVAGKEIALPHAFELDASPGFERFVFVTSDEPFNTADVIARLADRAVPLPPAFALHSLTVQKETP